MTESKKQFPGLRSRLQTAIAGDRLWDAASEPQRMVVDSEADEILYGGSSGCGKTALLFILAARYHHRSIAFRSAPQELKELIECSKNALGKIAKYHDVNDRKIWRDIPGDRTLEFGCLRRPIYVYEDWYLNYCHKYRGLRHDLAFYDEVTEFDENAYVESSQYSLCTINPSQKGRIVATFSHPMNPYAHWVVKRWSPWLDSNHPNPAKPGELRWFATIDGKDVEVESSTPNLFRQNARSRTFIPAKTSDNKFLKSEYLETLKALPEPLRSQMLYGEFPQQ